MTFTADTSSLYKIKPLLPQKVSGALSRLDKSALDRISEIRLRKNGICTVTVDGKNAVLTTSGVTQCSPCGIMLTKEDIDDFIYKFCKGSVYSHEDTLSEFYLTSEGIRAGLSGSGLYKGEKLVGIGEVSSVCIRLPHHIDGCSDELYSFIKEHGFPDGKGILISSSPGVGKTTLLRDLAIKLSDTKNAGFMRVCVIDERCEIYMDRIFEGCSIDFLSGIDRIKGMEIACRVLSSQVIICDEISGPDEAEKITRHKNTGFVFIASVHSASGEDALKKGYIRQMFQEGVFSHIYSLERNGKKVSGTLTEYA